MATETEFRRIALGMKDAVEGAHMGHPDFRVNGRIFATLHADPPTHLLCAGFAAGQWRITSRGVPDREAVVESGKNILLAELPGGRYRILPVSASSGHYAP